jgi:hypothetical protein
VVPNTILEYSAIRSHARHGSRLRIVISSGRRLPRAVASLWTTAGDDEPFVVGADLADMDVNDHTRPAFLP